MLRKMKEDNEKKLYSKYNKKPDLTKTLLEITIPRLTILYTF